MPMDPEGRRNGVGGLRLWRSLNPENGLFPAKREPRRPHTHRTETARRIGRPKDRGQSFRIGAALRDGKARGLLEDCLRSFPETMESSFQTPCPPGTQGFYRTSRVLRPW